MSGMDPLHLCISLGPLAVYMVVLGFINLSSRPFLTTGARDLGALGLAVSGFAVAGPMDLFFPENAAVRLGGVAWLLLLAFYALCLTLVVLLVRPRLVIYNTSPEQLRPMLAEIVAHLDPEHRWAGDSLALPQLGVQLTVESFGSLRNAQLVSAGAQQSYAGWRRLEVELANHLRDEKGSPNPYGVSLILFGVLMVGMITYVMYSNQELVTKALDEMLRM